MTTPLQATARQPSRLSDRLGNWARGSVGLGAIFLFMEAVGRAGIVDREYLPPASTVLARAVGLLGDGDFLTQVWATVSAWIVGLALTIVVAVPLGLILGSIPLVNQAARAIVEFLRPIPSVALIPLVGLLLDPGLELKVALIVYASTWPIFFNTIYGLQDVDPLAKETLRSFGFGRSAVLLRVSLPTAAPFIFTGIRLSASVALILAISTEIVSGRGDGIGRYIFSVSTAGGNIDLALAATVWTGTLGLLANALLVSGEQRLFRWHHAHRPGRS